MSTFDAAQIAAEAQERGEDPLATVIFQALGAASMAWDPRPTGVFDSTWAKEIGDSVMAYLVSEGPAGQVGRLKNALTVHVQPRLVDLIAAGRYT